MFRVPSTVLAVLALSAPLVGRLGAQTPEPMAADHTVVRGETLWDLAARYLGDPWDWPSIHDLNRGVVANPHWIYPGQTLRIPGIIQTGAVITGVTVIPAEGHPLAPGMALQPATIGGPGPGPPTVFRPQERSIVPSVMERDPVPWPAVARDAFLTAGWIDPVQEVELPAHEGVLSGFEGVAARTGERRTATVYSEVRITVTGPRTPGVGDVLLAFRPGRMIPEEGRIVLPTGLLLVRRIDGEGVVARVERLFDRVMLDDLVVPAPAYTVRAGHHPTAIEGGLEATILAFARPHELQIRGDVAFVDAGAAHGLEIGDEFIAMTAREDGWTGSVAGRLQVVSVRERTAAVRILSQDGAIFHAGLPVRLDRKMP